MDRRLQPTSHAVKDGHPCLVSLPTCLWRVRRLPSVSREVHAPRPAEASSSSGEASSTPLPRSPSRASDPRRRRTSSPIEEHRPRRSRFPMLVVNTMHRFTAEGAFPHPPPWRGRFPERPSAFVPATMTPTSGFPSVAPASPIRGPFGEHATRWFLQDTRPTSTLAGCRSSPVCERRTLSVGWILECEEPWLPPPSRLHMPPVTYVVPTAERPPSARRPRFTPRAHPLSRTSRASSRIGAPSTPRE